jgi:hypothetical protein
MANSPQLPFFAHNSTVKAWCHTAVSGTAITSFTTNKWDNLIFVDGYNLRLDPSNYAGGSSIDGRALKFSFITPMQDTKYKIFIQPGVSRPAPTTVYAHALNSTQFPKLTTSFWIRVGISTLTGPNGNRVLAVPFTTLQFTTNQIRVVVL